MLLSSIREWMLNENGQAAALFVMTVVPLLLAITHATEMMNLSRQKSKLQADVGRTRGILMRLKR